MGEVAEMILDGTLCQVCGEFMGDDCGYPRTCAGCLKAEKSDSPIDKVKCPTCGKKVKVTGLADHQRDTHSRRGGK